MGTTAIEPGKGSWRIEELENMDSLQAAKISLAMFAGTTMALAKQGRCVECAIVMDAAHQILDKLSKDVSKWPQKNSV